MEIIEVFNYEFATCLVYGFQPYNIPIMHPHFELCSDTGKITMFKIIYNINLYKDHGKRNKLDQVYQSMTYCKDVLPKNFIDK